MMPEATMTEIAAVGIVLSERARVELASRVRHIAG
jgi:hypothetical protein